MNDYYEELCPFCEHNIFLTYICEDCTAVFCGDCLKEKVSEELICSNCGHNELERNKAGKFYCVKCNSENIISVKKTLYTCPNCGESKIIKISEKFNKIKEEFKDIIIKTKKFTEPLALVVKNLLETRERLVRLRLNKPCIYHFPKFESELLQSIKLFENLKEAANKKTIDFYDDVNRNLDYFANLHSLPPKTIPILDGINENFKKNMEELQEFLNNATKKFDPKIGALNLKINFMESIQTMFLSYKEDLNLEDDEKPVFGLKCKLDTGSNNDNEYHSKNGVILLTNKKLYFIHERGMIKKKSALLFSVLLEDLQTVQVEGAITKKLSLEFVNSMYKFKISKENRDQLIDFIEKARIFDSNKIDETSLEAIREVEISIKNYQEALEEAIYAIISFCNNEYYTNIRMYQYNMTDNSNSSIPINSQSNNNLNDQKSLFAKINIKRSYESSDYKSIDIPTNPIHNNANKNSRSQDRYPNLNKWFSDNFNSNSENNFNPFINPNEYNRNNLESKSINNKLSRKRNREIANNYLDEEKDNIIDPSFYNTYKNRPLPYPIPINSANMFPNFIIYPYFAFNTPSTNQSPFIQALVNQQPSINIPFITNPNIPYFIPALNHYQYTQFQPQFIAEGFHMNYNYPNNYQNSTIPTFNDQNIQYNQFNHCQTTQGSQNNPNNDNNFNNSLNNNKFNMKKQNQTQKTRSKTNKYKNKSEINHSEPCNFQNQSNQNKMNNLNNPLLHKQFPNQMNYDNNLFNHLSNQKNDWNDYEQLADNIYQPQMFNHLPLNSQMNSQQLHNAFNQIRHSRMSQTQNPSQILKRNQNKMYVNPLYTQNGNYFDENSFESTEPPLNDYNSIMSMFPSSKKRSFLPFTKNFKKSNDPKFLIGKMEQLQTISKRVLDLEKRKFSLNRTLELLNNQLKQRLISENEYIQHYQDIQEELFSVEKEHEKLKRLLN
ncbi:MAG: PH domain-containing protein [Promethearchaeota archaeon]